MAPPQYNLRTVHGSPYTFTVKPKWRTVVFWFFAARSSAEAYFRSSPPRGHSTVWVPMRCEGFVAIWLRAREDIAHNRFQLLFINIDRYEHETIQKPKSENNIGARLVFRRSEIMQKTGERRLRRAEYRTALL